MCGSIIGWKSSAGFKPRSRGAFCRSFFKGCASGYRIRRGGRVVERGGLENRYTFTGTVGSNPTLSASPHGGRRWLAQPPPPFLLLTLQRVRWLENRL